MIKHKISPIVTQQYPGSLWVINDGSMRQITLEHTDDKHVVKIKYKDITLLVQTRTGDVTFITWENEYWNDNIEEAVSDLCAVLTGSNLSFG
ncbi:hypothetical protein Henu6_gp125 [Acinetobacter phage Henu6]|uniref:Uncharacterized protein n=1 Tax=Acinetobacter phage Henu6 TaxID=2500136 RepID=A0A410T5C3_9CAUD|nr:hypothetical protein Henu6_gp125 [Acinetobacter phage Henu6]